ncbi:MAG: hypothetical protein C9356_04925 [Oleiphilus sp.]|nr:MAG: hypothetical protein C9356_04925 [Oleiphilus sp.]
MPGIRKIALRSFISIALGTSSLICFAGSQDLLSLYKSATDYDAGIAAAKSAYLAVKQDENLALSGLLPSISATASTGDTNANSNIQNNQNYKTTNYSVALTQPLLDFGTWYNYTASEQDVFRAEADYFNAQQDLILDVANAYFGVLRAQEDMIAARALETAVKRQYEQAREQFDVGLIAITDVHEAKASYDDSKTTRIQSEGNLTLAIEQLSRLTGTYAPELHELSDEFPIALEEGSTSEAWVASAEQHNLQIKIASFAVAALEDQYQASKAGHYPTLNLSAGYDYTELNEFAPADRETEESNIFLNLNVPLYAGGGTQASVRKTRHLLEQAKHELQSATRQARIEARTEYINLKTNIQTVESLGQNIISRESALEATREGYKVGTRNIVEVLDAERNYFTALRDYANARFDFVESSLRIKKSAGTLSQKDIEELNQWLINDSNEQQ